MYDTITFYNELKSPVNNTHLTGNRIMTNEKTGEITHYANLYNLRVKTTGSHISISGSLPVYCYGSNIQSLSRKDTKESIESLSDDLSQDINNFHISRLDIAFNLILDNEVNNYLSCFGNLQHFKKQIYEEQSVLQTVLYSNPKRSFSFYDKKAERADKKVSLPLFLKNQNVLRYELQLNKQPGAILQVEELKGSMLSDECFYRQSSEMWKNEYLKIPKVRTNKFNQEVVPMLSCKNLENLLAAFAAGQIGINNLLTMLYQAKPNIDKREYYRLRNFINKLGNEPDLTEPNENIKELDHKINQVANFYR
jgi:hypothetical protein